MALTESEELELLELERERSLSSKALAPNLAGRVAKFTTDAITYPLTNPLALKLQEEGERVSGAVTSIGERLMRKAGVNEEGIMQSKPGMSIGEELLNMGTGATGAGIKLLGEFGELTPTNIALLGGGEVFGRGAAALAGRTAKRAVTGGARKVTSSVLGPSEEAISAAMRDPTVLTATIEDVTRGLPKIGNKFDAKISKMSGEAGKTLSTSSFIEPSTKDLGGAFTKDEVFSVVDKARENLGGIYGDETRRAAKALERLKEDFVKIRNTVSQKNVHDIAFKLDNEIPWDNVWNSPETVTPTDWALVDVRAGLDHMLKAKNPQYANFMKPVDEAMTARKEFSKAFGVKKIKGTWTVSDQAYNKVRSALRESKIHTEKILEQTKNITGEDLTPAIKKANYGEEFRGSNIHGSRSVLTAGGIGATAGSFFGAPFVGGAAGALLGSRIDRSGPAMAADLVRRYQSMLPGVKRVSKFAKPAIRTARKLPLTSPFSIGARILAERNGER